MTERNQPNINDLVSPSQTYVAMMWKKGFKGFYFHKFAIPSGVTNNIGEAAVHYYDRNVKPHPDTCLERVLTWEDYKDLQ